MKSTMEFRVCLVRSLRLVLVFFFFTFVVLPPALHFLHLHPVFLDRFLFSLTFRVLILSPCLIVRSFVYWYVSARIVCGCCHLSGHTCLFAVSVYTVQDICVCLHASFVCTLHEMFAYAICVQALRATPALFWRCGATRRDWIYGLTHGKKELILCLFYLYCDGRTNFWALPKFKTFTCLFPEFFILEKRSLGSAVRDVSIKNFQKMVFEYLTKSAAFKSIQKFLFQLIHFSARETACGQTRHCFWNRMGYHVIMCNFSEAKHNTHKSWKFHATFFTRCPKNMISKFSVKPFPKHDQKILLPR